MHVPDQVLLHLYFCVAAAGQVLIYLLGDKSGTDTFSADTAGDEMVAKF
jgi:hypothetical protein